MEKVFEYLSLLKDRRLYLVVSAVSAVWMLFFDSASMLTHRELSKEMEKLNKQKQFLSRKIEKDEEELQELYTKEDREKLGREVYYLRHDGEEVFIIKYDTVN